MQEERYDLVVIGSGPAGEKGAAQAAYFGKRVVLVEREEHDALAEVRGLRGALLSGGAGADQDRKSTRLNSSHSSISYAVFYLTVTQMTTHCTLSLHAALPIGMQEEGYDLVVIGSGPAGEKGAAQAAYFGKRVVLVEREEHDALAEVRGLRGALLSGGAGAD